MGLRFPTTVPTFARLFEVAPRAANYTEDALAGQA